jgi:hypothetical protein
LHAVSGIVDTDARQARVAFKAFCKATRHSMLSRQAFHHTDANDAGRPNGKHSGAYGHVTSILGLIGVANIEG